MRQHERIRSRGGDMLDVSQHTILEGLHRWWAGETREHNLTTVQTILDSAFGYIGILTERAEKSTGEGAAPLPAADLAFMQRLERELRGARQGCEGLQATYEDDSVARARISCMIESIDEQLEILTRWTGLISLRME